MNPHAPQDDEEREAVIARARAAGDRCRMVTICDKVSSFPAVRAVAETHDNIWCTVGTHPHEAKENPALTAQQLTILAEWERVVGIGETGLDFHCSTCRRARPRPRSSAPISARRATPACRWWSIAARRTT